MNHSNEIDMDFKIILNKIQLGDKRPYSLIIDIFQRKIYLYCYYLLRNQEEAEDATQDIFIKALEHIDRLTYTDSFSAWLYKIAKNHCTDRIKKKKKKRNY